MATLGEIANVSGYSSKKPSAVTGAAAMRATKLSTMNLYATMQGQQVLAQDFYVISQITTPMLRYLVKYFGVVLAETAKELHTPHIDTGDTYRSIQAGGYTDLPGGGAINVWVETPYAKFLEFGFVHAGSGQWIFNPFMIPAADAVTPQFVRAVKQVSRIVLGLRFLSGDAANSQAAGVLSSARGLLYSYSKYAGDIQALGIASGLSKSRGLALSGAKGIGNLQSVQHGTVGARLTRIVAGRAGGSFFRAGMVSGFGSGMLTGPSARIYNRLGGRAFGGALSGIR